MNAVQSASSPDAVREQERGENFPVAARMLPRRVRADLHAVYAVARTIDDLGDTEASDRITGLLEFRADLREIWQARTPRHAVLRALAPTVRRHGLDAEPFERLIEANLIDQAVSRYNSFDDLIGYCQLSADPVGRIVLAVFDQHTPANVELSDRVCRALQLIEHWQDVGEDRRAGRIYLPGEDLAAYRVDETDLDRPTATPALRALLRFEIDRAAALLESGTPLVGRLRGWGRVAVAGYVGGGRAAIAALRGTQGDVLARPTAPRRARIAAQAFALLLRPGGSR